MANGGGCKRKRRGVYRREEKRKKGSGRKTVKERGKVYIRGERGIKKKQEERMNRESKERCEIMDGNCKGEK